MLELSYVCQVNAALLVQYIPHVDVLGHYVHSALRGLGYIFYKDLTQYITTQLKNEHKLVVMLNKANKQANKYTADENVCTDSKKTALFVVAQVCTVTMFKILSLKSSRLQLLDFCIDLKTCQFQITYPQSDIGKLSKRSQHVRMTRGVRAVNQNEEWLEYEVCFWAYQGYLGSLGNACTVDTATRDTAVRAVKQIVRTQMTPDIASQHGLCCSLRIISLWHTANT